MNMLICCVYDRAVESYGVPIFVQHVGQAMRSFTDEVNNPESQFGRHPSDYSLYLIGSYDPLTGRIVGDSPSQLVSGSQVLKAPGA